MSYSNRLGNHLKMLLKQHGFIIAAELIETEKMHPRNIKNAITYWENYPKCMEIFPTVLTKKPVYNESF
jgi:hypothetical protein